jgi:hypothetical protein
MPIVPSASRSASPGGALPSACHGVGFSHIPELPAELYRTGPAPLCRGNLGDLSRTQMNGRVCSTHLAILNVDFAKFGFNSLLQWTVRRSPLQSFGAIWQNLRLSHRFGRTGGAIFRA